MSRCRRGACALGATLLVGLLITWPAWGRVEGRCRAPNVTKCCCDPRSTRHVLLGFSRGCLPLAPNSGKRSTAQSSLGTCALGSSSPPAMAKLLTALCAALLLCGAARVGLWGREQWFWAENTRVRGCLGVPPPARRRRRQARARPPAAALLATLQRCCSRSQLTSRPRSALRPCRYLPRRSGAGRPAARSCSLLGAHVLMPPFPSRVIYPCRPWTLASS